MNNYPDNPFPAYLWRLLLAAAVAAAALLMGRGANAQDCCCVVFVAAQPAQTSWIFSPGRYTHDPDTGARVGQYAEIEPVEPLPDQRLVTSGYTRSRTVLRGPDGGVTTSYRVQSYSNGRGGMDAEYERFHDAWRGATIDGGAYSGSYYQSPYAYAPYGYGNYGGYGGNWGNIPRHDGRGYGWGDGLNSEGVGPGLDNPAWGRIDPDGADGYRDGRRRTPDNSFYPPGFRPGTRERKDEGHRDRD